MTFSAVMTGVFITNMGSANPAWYSGRRPGWGAGRVYQRRGYLAHENPPVYRHTGHVICHQGTLAGYFRVEADLL